MSEKIKLNGKTATAELQLVEYDEYQVNGRTFRVNGPALVGTVSRAKCTIERIYEYPQANKPYPYADVMYPDGYTALINLGDLVHVDDAVAEDAPVDNHTSGWFTIELPTDGRGIDWSGVDEKLLEIEDLMATQDDASGRF